MGFFAGALSGLTTGVSTELDRQRALEEQSQGVMRQLALRGILDPNTPPELRSQYQAMLKGTPYEAFAGLDIPVTPEQQLQRRFGPLLSSLQALGALGQAGGLTPEVAAEIERMSGQQFLPRREVPGGPAPAPGQGVAGVALREEVDISRFQPAGVVSITLANGQTVPLEALRGLPAQLVMHLVKGPAGASAKTYGDLFGDIMVPGLRNRPLVLDDNGNIVLRPEFFVREPTPSDVQATAKFQRQQQAVAAYQESLRTTGDPQQAWQAGAALDPITFPPQTAITLANQQMRMRAVQAYQDWLATHPDDVAGATGRAVGIDPSFPRPATLPAPSVLTPQQEVWGKYFAGGSLNEAERTYIQRQLRSQADQDPRFSELMRTVTAFGNKRDLSPQEKVLYENALTELRAYFGIPPVEQGGPAKVDGFLLKLGNWLFGPPPAPGKVGGKVPSQRAQSIYDTWVRTKKPVPSRYWPSMTTDERRWLLAMGVKVEGLK